jgi:hypothetical protein
MEKGIFVQIKHDKAVQVPFFGWLISEQIIGKFFIGHIANQTLQYMKLHLEQNNDK